MRPRAIAKHVGILTGPATFIHAYERLGVIEETADPDLAAAHRLQVSLSCPFVFPFLAQRLTEPWPPLSSVPSARPSVAHWRHDPRRRRRHDRRFHRLGVGSVVDSWIVSSLAPAQRIEGARLDTLRITSATEGA